MKRRNAVLVSVVYAFCLILAASAQATVAISWIWDQNQAQGVYENGGSVLLPEGSTVQLIWSPDNIVSALNPLNPLTPTGGEIALATAATVGAGGGWWNLGTAYYDELTYGLTDTNQFASGYCYQRVFDVSYGSTPGAGDWYGDGTYIGAQLGNQHSPSPPPADASYLWSSGGSTPYVLNQQIIPEPGSLALMGVGLVVFGLRRKIRRR